MTIKQFEELKEKIESLKEKKIKAIAIIENIEKKWKEQYGLKDIEKLNEKKIEIEENINKLEKKKNNILLKIEDIIDWKEIE